MESRRQIHENHVAEPKGTFEINSGGPCKG